MTRNISLNENAAIVLSALGRCALPYQFAIAGGYARDAAHGVMPADIDVVVVGAVDPNQVIHYMKAGGYALSEATACQSEGVHDDRWAYILQFDCPGKLDVDVLISARNEDVIACVLNNDYNINHYIIGPHGEPVYLGAQHGILRQTRNHSVTPERAAHIEQKARDLGWVVPVTAETALPPSLES